MSVCSFKRAALAASVVVACGAFAAPATGQVKGALIATLEQADGQPVHGMVHIHMYPNGENHPSRSGLRALLAGLPPGARVSLRGHGGEAHEFDLLLATTADARGNVVVGIERPQRVAGRGLPLTGRVTLTYGSGDTGTHEVSAPAQPVRPQQLGERPDTLVAALHGTSGDGEHFFGLLHYDNGNGGPDVGVVSYIASAPTCEPALYRLSIAGGMSRHNFMDYTGDCLHWTSGREILVDGTTQDLIARDNSDLFLSRIVDGAESPLASSRDVKFGKLLGVSH